MSTFTQARPRDVRVVWAWGRAIRGRRYAFAIDALSLLKLDENAK